MKENINVKEFLEDIKKYNYNEKVNGYNEVSYDEEYDESMLIMGKENIGEEVYIEDIININKINNKDYIIVVKFSMYDMVKGMESEEGCYYFKRI